LRKGEISRVTELDSRKIYGGLLTELSEQKQEGAH
jgi:hypothetical protein